MKTYSLKEHSDSVLQAAEVAAGESDLVSAHQLVPHMAEFFDALHKELAALNKRISDLESAGPARAT